MGAIVFVLVVSGVIAAFQMSAESKRTASMTKSQRAEYQRSQVHGPINRQLVCPHCQTRGEVHTKAVKMKKGVSGAKATGAILSGGVSLLATGLSRKDELTEAFCSNCSSKWHF